MKMHSFNRYSHDLGAAVQDLWLAAKVKSALELSKSTRGQHIHVKAHGGAVSLSGQVATHRQCEQAIELARGVHGVAEVDGQELGTWMVAPGQLPEAPNEEETVDCQDRAAMDKDQRRTRH